MNWLMVPMKPSMFNLTDKGHFSVDAWPPVDASAYRSGAT